jgi:hypothetical protein
MGWRGTAKFRGISTGAACGFWCGGPRDSHGIPSAYCGDSSPNGTFLFTFDGVEYGYRFVAANEPINYQMRISNPVGIVSADSLRGQQIVVNIFAADPQTQVDFAVDGGTPRAMQYTPMRDSFMVDYINKNSQYYPSWIYVPKAFHIWTAPLPAELGVGTHKIEVRAQDSHRQRYGGIRLFEVRSGLIF